MGLAEPRKRVKISHDPRNLQWSSASENSTSFGRRLMQQQGWQQGQALGARPPTALAAKGGSHDIDAQRLAAAKVGVVIKDDTLGLGAQLRSKDVTHQKTGLDAFQGLLGRLNAKDEQELKEVERQEDDRKLAVYARGRWGGMVFVRGGILVQGEEFKKGEQQQTQTQTQTQQPDEVEEKEEKKKSKKEKKDKKKKDKKKKQAGQEEDEEEEEMVVSALRSPVRSGAPDEPQTSSEDESEKSKQKKKKSKQKKEKKSKREGKEEKRKRGRSSSSSSSSSSAATVEEAAPKKPMAQPTNGRHILRGRNIEAKRKAFSDAKGLDAIFMRTTTAAAAAAAETAVKA